MDEAKKEIKQLLTDPDFSSFKEFNNYQVSNAQFSRCTVNGQDMCPIYFHCKNCCKTDRSIYCLYCFDKDEHIGHKVTIFYGNLAVCDCGDPNAINRENWCEKHRTPLEPAEVSESYLVNFKAAISRIFELLSSNECKEPQNFHRIYKVLSYTFQWGTFYLEIISQILFEGNPPNFFKILKNIDPIDDDLIQQFNSMCYSVITSKKFVDGYISNFTSLLDFYEPFLLNYTSLSNIFTEAIGLSSQCISYKKNILESEKKHQIIGHSFKLLYNYISHYSIVNDNSEVTFHFSGTPNFIWQLFVDIEKLFEYPIIFLRALNDVNSTAITEIIKFISMRQIVNVIKRKEGEHELYQTDNYYKRNFIYLCVYELIPIISQCISLISTEFPKDQTFPKAIYYESSLNLNENNFKIIDKIFEELFSKAIKLRIENINEMSSEIFKQNLIILNPYNEFFPISDPLIDFSINTLICFSLHNNIDPNYLLKRIGFNDIDELTAYVMSSVSGNCLIQNNFFASNDESITDIAKDFEYHYEYITTIQICLQCCEDTNKIISIIAEEFGINYWDKNTATDLVECEKWTNLMTLLCRFLIIIACDTTFSGYHFKKESLRKAIIQYIYSGVNTREQLIIELNKFKVDNDTLDETFLEVADPQQIDKGIKLVLKPECLNEANVFLYISSSNFYNKINEHKEKLLTIPKLELLPDPMNRIRDFLKSKVLIKLMEKLLNANPSKTSYTLKRTIFALYRLILYTFPNETENKLMKITDLLISNILSLENGIKLLNNFVNESSEVSSMISNYVKSKIEIDESNKPKPKRIDRSAILAKFQKQLNAFADANSNELATFDSASPNSFTCAFCSESFNDNEEPYGIISTIYRTGILSKIEQIIAHDSIPRYPITCRVQTCGHWAHIKCFNSGNENVVYLLALNESIKQCPMDRTTCNTIIPVFENLNTQIEQEIERISSEIISLCGVSIAQTVAYNIALLEVLNRTEPKCIDDKKMILALIHLIRIAFIVKDNNVSDTNDPFALFAIDFFNSANLSDNEEIFQKMIKKYWKILAMSVAPHDKDIHKSLFEVFIRRVELLHQMASNPNDTISIPSVEEFTEKYELMPFQKMIEDSKAEITDIAFLSPCVKFEFTTLCENFVDFFYNENLGKYLKTEKVTLAKCLFCGKICYKSFGLINQIGLDDTIDHCMKCTEMTVTPFLMLTGNMASTVQLVDCDFGREHYNFGPVYFDQFGDSDIGFAKGSILKLNKTRVTRLIEMMLSGEYRRMFGSTNTLQEIIERINDLI